MILVCPAEHAPAIAREHAPSHVLGLAAPGEALDGLGAERSLLLAFNDIAEERPGLVPPNRDHVAAILAFGLSWDAARPLLVHCRMGISRSTAAAFLIGCARAPNDAEDAIARALRLAAPCATPNRLMVALADAALGREGRMSAAVAVIGRGADYVPYRVVQLESGGQAGSGSPT